MGKVYLVEAWYENYESSWSKLIGIFDDIEVANNLKEKWDNFYKENKNIFDKPKDWEPVVDIGNYGSIEDDWTECMEYWTLKTKYEEISTHVKGISRFRLSKRMYIAIEEICLNKLLNYF